MARVNGALRHTFTATGVSPSRYATDRTLVIQASDAFVIDCEVSYDDGVTWSLVKQFTAEVAENFLWSGNKALIRFNCTTFTSADVIVIFE